MSSPRPSEVVGYVVRDRSSGQVVFHEVMPSAKYSVDRLNSKMAHRVEQLETRYPYPQYEVEPGIYADRETFYDFYPNCTSEKEGLS